MSSAAARATRRNVIDHANKTATATQTALDVAIQIGQEWRIFCNLTLFGRMWWLLTGQIRFVKKLNQMAMQPDRLSA